jgi:hypothetical protein
MPLTDSEIMTWSHFFLAAIKQMMKKKKDGGPEWRLAGSDYSARMDLFVKFHA